MLGAGSHHRRLVRRHHGAVRVGHQAHRAAGEAEVQVGGAAVEGEVLGPRRRHRRLVLRDHGAVRVAHQLHPPAGRRLPPRHRRQPEEGGGAGGAAAVEEEGGGGQAVPRRAGQVLQGGRVLLHQELREPGHRGRHQAQGAQHLQGQGLAHRNFGCCFFKLIFMDNLGRLIFCVTTLLVLQLSVCFNIKKCDMI